ncbi:CBS domain-containing protein [Neptunomonas qingdaonensis]|uniref:CBS domain-containing protein n=1 Tax=Neptunomonas qingdaonensis TaxID=1045558 RepID=A0A1I2NNS4_9GAMM|nr:CBS domain-containing protein [Neptunomonas qingdaonensis]SFG05554.1 CBS domain-containing protein [Neptunomonas qingdaonensis]
MLKSVKVQDYMATGLVTFHPETDLFAAINSFLRYKISGAPVTNEQGELVGIISEVDCLKAILTLTYHEEEVGGTVGNYMTPNVETIGHDANIIEVARIFIDKGRRRLPVTREGKLVGQISRSDILRAVEEFAQHT